MPLSLNHKRSMLAPMDTRTAMCLPPGNVQGPVDAGWHALQAPKNVCRGVLSGNAKRSNSYSPKMSHEVIMGEAKAAATAVTRHLSSSKYMLRGE
jgi:hypothetical protein